MTGNAAPLYIVCSPCRSVGKTLLARVLTELHSLDERPIEAFDLADESPRLADYLPDFTTVTGIGDVAGQMTFFERLVADNSSTTIVDVSHRAFERFFTVVHEIGFFAEARRQGIEPVILFITAPDPRSSHTYAVLRERFLEASLLPVYNQSATSPDDDSATGVDAHPSMLRIAQLGFALQVLVDQPTFSFGSFWETAPPDLAPALDGALLQWTDGIAHQIAAIATALGYDGPSAHLRRQPRRESPSLVSDLPDAVRTFAPRRLRSDDALASTGALVDLLRQAERDLRDAEERINALEIEVEHYHSRATRAEAWLTRVRREIEERLLAPAATVDRAALDDLGCPSDP
ncbi:MAG: hypothetical protein IT537_18190 [Hyphomicrobiales bacterium]|nr:hypothetical protein [Hyphomicrobiales bacterium]